MGDVQVMEEHPTAWESSQETIARILFGAIAEIPGWGSQIQPRDYVPLVDIDQQYQALKDVPTDQLPDQYDMFLNLNWAYRNQDGAEVSEDKAWASLSRREAMVKAIDWSKREWSQEVAHQVLRHTCATQFHAMGKSVAQRYRQAPYVIYRLCRERHFG